MLADPAKRASPSSRGPAGQGTKQPFSDALRDDPGEAPTLAFFAVFLGGILILVEGLIFVAGGANTFRFAITPASSAAVQLGGIGVALGIGILATGFVLHENLAQRRSAGALLLVLGTLSLLSGGGFLVGLGATVVGGLIAVLRRPPPFHRAVDRPGRER